MSAERDHDVARHNTLVRVIRRALGLPENVAVLMAEHLARELSRETGGMYIPKREISREVRDQAVLRDFNGRNHHDVIRQHGISRATFFRIIGKSHNREK